MGSTKRDKQEMLRRLYSTAAGAVEGHAGATVAKETGPNIRTTNALKKAQLDLKMAYQEYDKLKEVCNKRKVRFPLSDSFRSDYEQVQKITETVLNFKHESKHLQKLLKDLKIAQKKQKVDNVLEQEKVLDKLSKYKPIINERAQTQSDLEDKLFIEMSSLPNFIHPSVKENQVLVEYLNPTEDIKKAKTDDYVVESNSTFDHKDIMERLGLVNFSQATKISGRGWYYLLGDGALLEQALIQYALKKARQAGFKMAIPPSIVKTEVTKACGFMPRDTNNETQVYELQQDNLCLTGTAEIPLAALYANHEFKNTDLPTNLVGLSRSYRAEAGAAGSRHT